MSGPSAKRTWGRLALALGVLGAVAVAAAAGQAAARTGVCLPGTSAPACEVWFGRVTAVHDADTISVNVWGDGRRKPRRVRIAGINAMEQRVYTSNVERRRGDCHALDATARLEHLLKRGRRRVRLAAQDPAARSGFRLRRAVSVKIGGRWRDLGRVMVVEGRALWLPNRGSEWAWNAQYSWLAQRAAAERRLGLWDPDFCRAGPAAGAPLRLWVNWDQRSQSGDGSAGEWVKIRNLDPAAALPLGGWSLRDSALRRYRLPTWASVPPGGTLTVHIGEGTDTWTDLHWTGQRAIFDNASHDDRARGDGAYLFDPEGDLRASMIYPCRYACADPNEDALDVNAHARGREWVTLRNFAAWPVDLEGYRLSSPPQSYAFGPDSVLHPGETMRVAVKGDPATDTRLRKHWGLGRRILFNRGDVVRVQTFTDITVGCDAWGRRSC